MDKTLFPSYSHLSPLKHINKPDESIINMMKEHDIIIEEDETKEFISIKLPSGITSLGTLMLTTQPYWYIADERTEDLQFLFIIRGRWKDNVNSGIMEFIIDTK